MDVHVDAAKKIKADLIGTCEARRSKEAEGLKTRFFYGKRVTMKQEQVEFVLS